MMKQDNVWRILAEAEQEQPRVIIGPITASASCSVSEEEYSDAINVNELQNVIVELTNKIENYKEMIEFYKNSNKELKEQNDMLLKKIINN
ncbi:hypothetical protein [Clostridium sp. 3-3]|uniref:hypothetical protein n=1 Tax=Clostridium sp. 3-3 TaxID=2070757 RepID=UPI000CDA2C55|nr:hypothetical protein [Clostridium sp. 3-3]POO85078.1 hypothetical protein C1H59_17950 [Clostridium sp. 3-3]